MSLLDFLRGGNPQKRDPPALPVDSDDNGEVLYSDDLVTQIKQELERRRTERIPYELKWSLNANFLAGNQNCEIDMTQHTVVTEGPVERVDRERRCYNRIAPLMETRDANLGSVKYDMVVNPRTSDADDLSKAKVSTALLQYIQSNVDFRHKSEQLRRWMEVCGTAFSLSWWDRDAGEVVAQEVSEEIGEDGTVRQSVRDIRLGEIGTLYKCVD